MNKDARQRRQKRRLEHLVGRQPGPWFWRKRGPKNSVMNWGEFALGGEDLYRLDMHMDGLTERLHAMFQACAADAPRYAEFFGGGVHGFWRGCPNGIADEVEKLVKTRHASFMTPNAQAQAPAPNLRKQVW